MKFIMKLLPLMGFIILFSIILKIGPKLILETFFEVNIIYLIPTVFLFILYFSIQSFKWWYLIKQQSINLTFLQVFKLYIIGIFYGIITPARIGNFIRIQYLKERTNKNLGECSVSVIIERMLDFMVLLFLTMVSLIFFVNYISVELFISFIFIYLVFFTFAFIFFKKEMSRKILRIFWKFFIPKKMKTHARQSFNSFYKNIINWKKLILPFGFAVFGWLVLYLAVYSVGLSVGINLPYYIFLIILPLGTIIGLLPVTVGGWGTREAVLIFMFSFFGTTPEKIVVMTIVASFLNYLITGGLGFYLSLKEEFKVKK